MELFCFWEGQLWFQVTLTWHTKEIRISNEIWIAHAFIRRWIARCANTTDYTFTSTFAPSTYAHAWFCARHFRRTNIWLALTTRERITHETFDTFARWSTVTHDTLCSRATDETIALCVTIFTVPLLLY